MGLCQQRHPGLLTAWQADRQRLHLGVQQQAAVGVPERPLIPDPCGFSRRGEDLASILQRGTSSLADRIWRPDTLHQPGGTTSQPSRPLPETLASRRSKILVQQHATSGLFRTVPMVEAGCPVDLATSPQFWNAARTSMRELPSRNVFPDIQLLTAMLCERITLVASARLTGELAHIRTNTRTLNEGVVAPRATI